jgi:tyrosyl-tRNA synthetase
MTDSIEKQLELIARGADEIFPLDELKEKLSRSLDSGRPMRVKLGVDPSTKDLHLGHTVVLRKLRQFQDLGHKAVLIIGDGTGLVGDPSGRDATRPQLTPGEIDQNAQTYIEQAGTILDVKNPDKFEMRRNGDWFREMDFFQVVNLASRMTVARLLERDDFNKRFGNQTPIYLHEMLYPIMQGWDSVVVEADIELGGTDQKYNLLVGRDFQRAEGQKPQICLTLPLLVGTDGVQKMSKSYHNYIGITEAPKAMFDKTLSIPDSLSKEYYTLLTARPLDEVDKLIAADPLEAKLQLALDIIEQYHDRDAADMLKAAYLAGKNAPDELMQKVKVSHNDIKEGKIWLVKLLTTAKFAASNSEARKLISASAVSVDGTKITDPDTDIEVREGQLLQVGKKRIAAITIIEEE